MASETIAQHTPAPWIVESADWPDDEPGIVRYYVRHNPPEIAFPNARLIAAAPDLLAALKEARAELAHHYPDDSRASGNWPSTVPMFARLDAAIAKAEGRS